MNENTDNRITTYINTIQNAWSLLQNKIENLPNVVVIILSLTEKKKHGHLAVSVWSKRGKGQRDEFAISPKLFKNKYDTLSAILHEAAHAVLSKTTPGHANGHYHKKEFRDFCRHKLGINCEWEDTRYGWMNTSIDKKIARQRYREELELLSSLPNPGVIGPPIGEREKKEMPKSSLLRAYCQCPKKRYITVTPANYSDGESILCTQCNSFFEVKNK